MQPTSRQPFSDTSRDPSATEHPEHRMQHARERVKDQAAKARHEAKSKALAAAGGRKEDLANRAGDIAKALRSTGEQFHMEDNAWLGRYAESLGDRVDDLSAYLRSHEVSDLIGEVESFARRKPVLFLSGAAVMGFLATRFLKSSTQEQPSEEEPGEADYRLAAPSDYEPLMPSTTASVGPERHESQE